MTARKILTVALELATDSVEYATFSSKVSLLDWDIVLLKPDISEYHRHAMTTFQGKPRLEEHYSFQLREACEHWKREIRQAVDAGKTIIVYLPRRTEVYVDTGQRTYSGTGRNQRVTQHVDLYSNYSCIPASLVPVDANGKGMKLFGPSIDVLTAYWTEFESVSQYRVTLTDPKVPACIVTKAGEKPVGALYRSKASTGSLLLLPDIDFEPSDFLKRKGDDSVWTPAAAKFAGRFVSTIVALDKALRGTAEVSPEPAWVGTSRFALPAEASLREALLDAERRAAEAQARKETHAEALRTAGAMRALLYEKGKALENVIIQALRLLGFTAEPYRDATSEFDVVFTCPEGRLIGEAEGKDSKAVNIDKLRQLSMNIHEDLQRESVDAPAKPVLFGNGCRLQPLDDRPDPFTAKCQAAAATSSTALVFTPDLFWPVQYLSGQQDAGYATLCRLAVLSANGRVAFPAPPTKAETEDHVEAHKPG